MGKNHRHKKDLKAEKAKVKLKQSKTKFLPKGQNVTNTSFKIKPIVLPEQLKQKDSEDILSKRKLNIKDLLSRIKHYNENVRYAACEELVEMIKIHTKEIIQQHLSQICLAISSLMQDKERKVRKSAVKCIDIILECIPSEKLMPFFDFFSTNLRCAMTNIDKNIQEDSLSFLDCFIKTDCGLISRTSEKLLPDFLSLISKLRNDSQLGRTLTLNLGSKMTSVAWRIKVLSRLHAVLNVILKKEDENVSKVSTTHDIFDASKSYIVPIYKGNFGRNLDQPTFDLFSTRRNNSFNKGLETINRHIVTLIPLLYETWLEVMPEQKVQKSAFENTVLSDETAAMLTCITNTLYLLWKYVKQIENEELNLKSVFMSNEGQKFLTHLLTNFPYSQTGGRTKKSKNSSLNILEHNNDPKCIHENLLVCFIYSVLYVNCTQHNLKKEMATIVSYITKLLFQKYSLGEESMQCFLRLLRECLGKNYQKWRRSGMDLQIVLENIVMFYDHGKLRNEDKLELFHILSSVINNELLISSTKYQNWLSILPNILCQPDVPDTTILALLELSKKNSDIFHTALVRKLPDILDNLPKIKIIVTSDSLLQNEETAKINLANIFYYVPRYSNVDLEIIQTFINTSQCSFKIYFQQVLSLRNELRNY